MRKPAGLAVAFVAALAVAFLPLPPVDIPGAAADTGEYEYEVLPGIRRVPPANLRMTTGWHNVEKNAIDLAHYEPPGSYSYGVTFNAPVRAYFRHVGGDKPLKARIMKHRSGYGCKGIRVEILDGTKSVASFSYVHLEMSADARIEVEKEEDNQERRKWDLRRNQQDTVLGIVLGTLVRERRDADGVENEDILGVENNKTCSTGPHIHMAGYNPSTGSTVVLNKSASANRGLPDVLSSAAATDRACIAPDLWLMKIVSPGRTADVTATTAPTNTCPPTNLRLSKPSDDDDRLDLAYEVSQPSTVYEEPYRIQTPGYPDGMKFELYRAASEVELCEPEESTCSAQYTEMVHFCGADETPAADNCAPSPTTTPAQSVAFDGLDGGYFYQARGTGCVHKSATDDTLVCGAWSGLSGAVQVPATPPPTPIPVEPVEPPPLTIRADVDPETCLTGGTVTIDWEVSGARGEVSVSVAGYFVPRSRETGRFVNVPCMDEAGVQSETVIAVDDGPPLRRASDTVRFTVNARSGGDCLHHNAVNTFTSWRADCASTTASTLLNALSDDVCGIWLWVESTSSWVRYSRTSEGTLVPGSVNFTIAAGNTLWIGGCTAARDGAIGPPGPPPKHLTS